MAIFHQNLLAIPNRLSIVDVISLANNATDASRSLSISSHTIGDMILVMTANNTATPPALLSGYTNAITNGGTYSGTTRALRVQYKISNNSTESITWTGGYGYMCAIRFASNIGATNINTSLFAGTGGYNIPNISNLDTSGGKLIIAGHYLCASNAYNSISTTPPYVRRQSSNLNEGCFLFINNNTEASYTGKQANSSQSLLNILYTIEIK